MCCVLAWSDDEKKKPKVRSSQTHLNIANYFRVLKVVDYVQKYETVKFRCKKIMFISKWEGGMRTQNPFDTPLT